MEHFFVILLHLLLPVTAHIKAEHMMKMGESKDAVTEDDEPLSRVGFSLFFLPFLPIFLLFLGEERPYTACSLLALDHNCKRTQAAWESASTHQGVTRMNEA